MMRRLIVPLALFAGVVGGFGVYLSCGNSTGRTSSAAEPVPTGGTPRVELDHDSHEFGVMDVGQTGKHTFAVRNSGDADLVLTSGGTSCKCTLLNTPSGRLKPGESKEVLIEWKTLEPKEHYRQGGVLNTNDPQRPQVAFFIEGKVRAKFASAPEEIVFGDVREGEPREQTVLVYSQFWSELGIAKVESPWPQLTCTLLPAQRVNLEKHQAASGHELLLKLEPGLNRGTWHGPLRVWLEHGDATAQQSLDPREIPVTIDVVSDFSLHGRNVDGTCVRMGAVRRGQTRQERLYLIVRGEHHAAEVLVAKPTEDFLNVRIERDSRVSGNVTRHQIEVEVPADAPAVDYMGGKAIHVELHTTHPRTPVVRFQVELAVVN